MPTEGISQPPSPSSLLNDIRIRTWVSWLSSEHFAPGLWRPAPDKPPVNNVTPPTLSRLSAVAFKLGLYRMAIWLFERSQQTDAGQHLASRYSLLDLQFIEIFLILFLFDFFLSLSLLPCYQQLTSGPKHWGFRTMGWNLQNHELKSTLPPSLLSKYFYHGDVKLPNIHSKWFSVYMQTCIVNIPI